MSKDFTIELTGKDSYETGDLSKEIDKRVKNAVTEFCGKEEGTYEFGDLSKEMNKRVQDRVAEFTGRDEYSFGDITKEIENRRQTWVKDFLGEEAAKDYQFGDITKKALTSFTGKDEYEFGKYRCSTFFWVVPFFIESVLVCFISNKPSRCDCIHTVLTGDVTKKVLGNLFGPRKRGGKN